MTDYVKLGLEIVVSEDERYIPKIAGFLGEYESRPVTWHHETFSAPPSPDYKYVYVSEFTTIDYLVIVNTGAEALEIIFEMDLSTTTIIITAGKFAILPNIDVGTDVWIQSDGTGASPAEVFLGVTA